MDDVHVWEDGDWLPADDVQFDESSEPVNQLTDAGYQFATNVGDFDHGFGITLYTHESGVRWFISLVLCGDDIAHLIVKSPEQLFRCLKEFTPIAEAGWHQGTDGIPKAREVFVPKMDAGTF